jgi:hypothetical protein
MHFSSLTYAAQPAYLILLDLTIIIIFAEEQHIMMILII